MSLLGPDSLADLRIAAKDPSDHVRMHAVLASYTLLEFDHPQPRWPPPSDALIAEVRTFLIELQRDPSFSVKDRVRSMLANIKRQHP